MHLYLECLGIVSGAQRKSSRHRHKCARSKGMFVNQGSRLSRRFNHEGDESKPYESNPSSHSKSMLVSMFFLVIVPSTIPQRA